MPIPESVHSPSSTASLTGPEAEAAILGAVDSAWRPILPLRVAATRRPVVADPIVLADNRPRVLHVLDTTGHEWTGIVRLVATLMGGLRGRYSFHAIVLDGGGPLDEELRREGAIVEAVRWRRGVADLAGAWAYWTLLRTRRFDIVHSHGGGRALRLLARLSGGRVLAHIHSRTTRTATGPRVLPIPGGAADAVVAVSHAVAGLVRGGPVRVIHSGVEAESPVSAPPISGNGPVVGCLGRLIPLKGTIHLLRALAVLRRDFPSVRLELAGDGPERPRLEMEAQHLDIADRVTFLGWIPVGRRLLARWDVLAHPSLDEALPVAILEAMAAGRPVVASAVGGIPEAVVDGVTGVLVPPGDPLALAGALRVMLVDRALRDSMGKAARCHFEERFSAERMVRAVGTLYEELLHP